MRTDAEIQAIIDDPKYAGWTKKDFRNAGILTRTETERKGLTFQHYGKKKDPTKVRKKQTKRTEQTKATSNVTTEQKLAAPKKSGLELSHLGSKKALVTPNNLAYLPKYTNKLSYFRFEKILNGIQADQQKILADTTMSAADKRKALAELAKADRTLRNKFKGQGYDNIKSRIKTREFPWGMGETEIIRDPSITLGEGKAGANIPLKTATKTEKANIIQLGKENLEKSKPKMPSIKYDDTLGAFVKSGTDDVVSQAGLKAWAKDNPMPVQAGTSVKPGLLRKTGRALAHVGLPLPTAAMDTYFIGRQIEEGRDPVDIAKDPFNWLGLATMEPLTKAAGVADKSGKLASVMRLGMSPGMIRGATRFLGLPGLAISTGLTAYDQYKKYQDKEGFIYDLFNKVDNTDV